MLMIWLQTWIDVVTSRSWNVIAVPDPGPPVFEVAVVAVVRVREEGAAGVVEAVGLAVHHGLDPGEHGQVVSGVVHSVVKTMHV